MEKKSRKRSRKLSDLDSHKITKRVKQSEASEAAKLIDLDLKQRIKNACKVKFPLRDDGTTLHLNVKTGDVANRILSVGDTARAIKISKFFDKPEHTVKVISVKTFRVFTGTFRGVPVSIIATGMGYPMIDFVVREIRHVIEGPMAMIRYGTCGVINPDYQAGQVLVAAKGSIFAQTNCGEIIKGNRDKAYTIAKPVLPDIGLSALLVNNMREIIGRDKVKEVMNCSADSFYGSEGRFDPNFEGYNETLIDDILSAYPQVVSLEMESFGLLNLATESMHCTAAAIGLIQRGTSVLAHARL